VRGGVEKSLAWVLGESDKQNKGPEKKAARRTCSENRFALSRLHLIWPTRRTKYNMHPYFWAANLNGEYVWYDYAEKYCRAMQATDENTIRRMRLACWITTATANTQECVIRVAF